MMYNATRNNSPIEILKAMQDIVHAVESHTSRNAHGKAAEVKRITRAAIDAHKGLESQYLELIEADDEDYLPHHRWRKALSKMEQVERWVELIEAELAPTDWTGGAVKSVAEGLDLIIEQLAETARNSLHASTKAITELEDGSREYTYATTDEGAGLLKFTLVDLGTMQAYRYDFNNVRNSYEIHARIFV